MKRSSTLNLALVWAGSASLLTGLASLPFLAAHHPAVATASVESTFRAATTTPKVITSTTPPAQPAATASIAPRPARSATPVITRSLTPSATAAAALPRATTQSPTATATPTATLTPSRPKPTSKPKTVAGPTGNYVQVGDWSRSIVIARGSQAAINACGAASLWAGPMPGQGTGTTWLAGHNYCGFAFWDALSIGARITIHDSAGTFVYQVVSRTRLNHQGGTAVGILHDDLILQTCTTSGTSLTYADLVSSTS